jgi:hypothetical protein
VYPQLTKQTLFGTRIPSVAFLKAKFLPVSLGRGRSVLLPNDLGLAVDLLPRESKH